jgi:hypothetical protein
MTIPGREVWISTVTFFGARIISTLAKPALSRRALMYFLIIKSSWTKSATDLAENHLEFQVLLTPSRKPIG